MNEINAYFNKYLTKFEKLTNNEKRDILIDSTKELIDIFEKIANNDNIKLHYLEGYNKNILDKDNYNEEIYLQKQLIYLEIAKNIIGEYLLNKNI